MFLRYPDPAVAKKMGDTAAGIDRHPNEDLHFDKDNFDVAPEITNNGTVHNWTDNRHGIVGYLDDQNVAKVVLAGLQ